MDFFISLIAILAISMFLCVRFKLNSAITPFVTVAGLTIFMCLCGILNLLYVAGLAVFAFAIFSLVYVFYIKKKELGASLKAFLTPGIAFFAAACIFFFFALKAEDASFLVWDEFSFWGTAAKNVFEHRQLYTLFESSMINISYPPALSVFSFFIQFFGGVFAEYKVYLAYAIIEMAVMTIFFSRLDWKKPISIIVTSFFSLACIYLFWWSLDGLVAYCTSYADYILGYVFAAPLLIYFSDETRGLPKFVAVLLGLMLLPLTKDVGFALGLIAATVIAADMVLFKRYPTDTLFNKKSKLLLLVYPLLLYVANIASYLMWTLHFNTVTHIPRVEVFYEYSALEIFTGKDPYFNTILSKMIAEIPTRQLYTVGTMLEMIILFTLLPIIVSLFTKSKKQILRTSLMSFLMLCGFALYYVFMAYLYAAIFYHTETHDLVSFGRYISSHTFGWMLVSFGVCMFEITKPFWKRFTLLLGTGACALLMVAHFYFCPVHPDQYVFTSWKVNAGKNEIREYIDNTAGKFRKELSVDDRIYFICQESSGGEWFVYNYAMQPAYVVKTFGGGYFVPMETADADMPPYSIRANRANFSEFLREQDVDFVYVYKTDDYFINEFSSMFSDNLVGFFDGSGGFYMVIDNGGSELSFEAVGNSAALAQLREDFGK